MPLCFFGGLADEFRRGLVNILKQGLVPYLSDTPLAEFISVTYSQKKDFRPTPATDPWHYWVFGLSLRGNGELEDLHGVTVFLASDASAYITGQTIFVDGGFSAK